MKENKEIGVFYIQGNLKAKKAAKDFLSNLPDSVDLTLCSRGDVKKLNLGTIITLGGDGTVLRAIQKYYKLNVPFYGINYGKLGFLTNQPQSSHEAIYNISNKAKKLTIPIFQCDILSKISRSKKTAQNNKKNVFKKTKIKFINDANVFRSSGQSAQLKVQIDDKVVIENVNCDGVLAFSPLGSTGYNESIGGKPMSMNMNSFGLRVIAPSIRDLLVSKSPYQEVKQDSAVTITNINPELRPCNCGIDGQTIYNIAEIKVSKILSQKVTLLLMENI